MSWMNGTKTIIDKTLRIVAYFTPYRRIWLFVFFTSVLLSGLGLLNPLIIRFLIDEVILEKKLALLTWLMIFLTGLTLFSVTVRVLSNYFHKKLSLSILYDARNKFFAHLERLDLGFFQKNPLGDILSRLETDIYGIEEFVSLIFNRAMLDISALLFTLAIAFALDWKITLIMLIAFPLYIISERRYAKKVRTLFNIFRRLSANMLSFLEERLSSMAFVQIFGREQAELAAEKRKARQLIKVGLQTTLTQSIAASIIGLITFFALLFVLWYGGYKVIHGTLTLGTLIALYYYLGGVFSPLESLASLYTDAQSSLASIDRVFAFLDRKPAIADKSGAKPMPEIKGEIVFDNVTFAYDERPHDAVLRNVSFNIPAGEVVGLVGPSGVGKTTLAHLIMRFYDPIEGRVLIDGHDISTVTIDSLRSQIGFIRQDITLFNASIRENIAYGKRGAAFEQIKEAARRAQINEFIERLPHKYSTNVGEKGMKLSAGERQRISIARMFLKDPRIILLDEATSYLDAETEAKVRISLNELMRGRTSVIIAHRLSTIEAADRIFMLGDGGLLEQGTFAELLEKRGRFHQFYQSQFGSFYRFQEKLAEALQRAAKDKPMLLASIRVKDIEKLEENFGYDLLDHMLEEISSYVGETLTPRQFAIHNPNQKDMFYVAMPEGKAEEAQTICKLVQEKWPDVRLACGYAEGQPGSRVDDILKESVEKSL